MKNTKLIKIILITTLVLTVSACDNKTDNDKAAGEPKPTITSSGKTEEEPGEKPEEEPEAPVISVEKIDRIENAEISDWLEEETVIVSKENDTLDKMELAELSDNYPRSLYLYNINTKEYKLLKERENVFLGGAALSADRKHLLYSEYTLGDPVYNVMNLDTGEAFGILGDNFGGAVSAGWAGNEVIGAAYYNGAYIAAATGEISIIEDLKEEALFVIRKIKDTLYYNTNYDETLIMLNVATKEKKKLDLAHVSDVIPSPDGNKILVLQGGASKHTLFLLDPDGSNQKMIAEGSELGGISWSPGQQRIAYYLKDEVNDTAGRLYLYDIPTGEVIQVAEDIRNAVTCWSPSGERLAYAEWDGEHYNSGIIDFK